MRRLVTELKTGQTGRGLSSAGKHCGGGAAPRPTHRTARFFLKVCQYLCLLLALVCLGNVALDFARAWVFQAYQSWQFDRDTGHQSHSITSFLIGWIDKALNSPTGQRVARLDQDLMKWIDQELDSDVEKRVVRLDQDLMGWIDQALSSHAGQHVAWPVQNKFRSNSPAMAGRGSVPAPPSLPAGTLIGRMAIPKVGISVMVLEGDGDDILGEAAGHVPTTAFPGGPGNVVIAGHRDTFFRALRKIRKDDEITFTTTQGTYHYQVASIDKVGPQDVQVLAASNHPTLTLITCYPFDYIGPAPMRFVVRATEMQSSPIAEREQTLASARPILDPPAGARSRPSTRHEARRLVSSRPVAKSAPTLVAKTLAVSAPVADGSESAQEPAKAQRADLPAKSPSTSHKMFGKVRGWLGSIPRHLRHDSTKN